MFKPGDCVGHRETLIIYIMKILMAANGNYNCCLNIAMIPHQTIIVPSLYKTKSDWLT